MPLALGTETLDAYYDVELAGAAHKLVTEMRPVEPGHQVACHRWAELGPWPPERAAASR